MKLFYAIGLAASLAVASGPSLADCQLGHCEVGKPIFHFDKPAKVEADCSFSEAGNGWSSDFFGKPATDVGGGRVGQRWVLTGGCVRSESVVVVDCFSKESVQIRGVCAPPGSKFRVSVGNYAVDLLYPPHGELRLSSQTTVNDLVNLSKRLGYDHWTSFEDVLSRAKKKNRINPYCGCKLYYPDSPGAKL